MRTRRRKRHGLYDRAALIPGLQDGAMLSTTECWCCVHPWCRVMTIVNTRSLLECAASGRSSQCGTVVFLGLPPTPSFPPPFPPPSPKPQRLAHELEGMLPLRKFTNLPNLRAMTALTWKPK